MDLPLKPVTSCVVLDKSSFLMLCFALSTMTSMTVGEIKCEAGALRAARPAQRREQVAGVSALGLAPGGPEGQAPDGDRARPPWGSKASLGMTPPLGKFWLPRWRRL